MLATRGTLSDEYPGDVHRNDAIIELRDVSKTFGQRQVLSNVDLVVRPGEVHALLGQNGSGKSTLIKILAGYQPPDQGAELLVRGQEVKFPLHPNAPSRLGFSFVHQDLGLIPSMTVAESVLLGRFETRSGWRISWKRERRRVERIIAESGVDVSPDALIEDLSAVDRTLIAIMRALDRLKAVKGGLLVLDEPTAALPHDNVERLFGGVHQAASRGVGILLVTHRMDEVRRFADRVTVLRDGKRVETCSTSGLTQDELVERIIGFPLDRLYPAHRRFVPSAAHFEVEGLSAGTVNNVSFSVARGEVLGLTGLLGMGAAEVPYLAFGAEPAESGAIRIGEKVFPAKDWKPRKAINSGLAFLPVDRLGAGGVGQATVRENLTLGSLSSFSSRLWLSPRKEAAQAWELVREHNVVPQDPEAPLGTLSGGNQQKALLGKWFATKPSVLLLHDPTRGIDVGAKKQVFASIRQAAVSGTAVVIASDEYEDLANLCDRVLVFGGGQITCELSGSELNYERVLERCYAAVPPDPVAARRNRGSHKDRKDLSLNVYDIPIARLDGSPSTVGELTSGKVALLVNVASQCGYTSQYQTLEALHEKHADRGFIVVGLPCNQFGEQEPGSSEEIAQFCSRTYGVTFPMTEKIEVNGPNRHPLYERLTSLTTASGKSGDVRWNFEKFLLNAAGEPVSRFSSQVTPDDPRIVEAIEALLPTP